MKNLLLISTLILFAVQTTLNEPLAQSICDGQYDSALLEASGVRTKIFNDGSLFTKLFFSGRNDDRTTGYRLKEFASAPLFGPSHIWIGGFVNGEVRTTGSGDAVPEFSPGPVDSVRTQADCEGANHIYRIARRDFDALDRGVTPSDDVSNWPWQQGAPVVDGDGIPDNYNLAGGDRPELLGHESVFWIMNDVENDHHFLQSPPLGIELHGTAFSALDDDPNVNNATFYRYRIINRSASRIDSVYFAIYADADVGAPFDDFLGSDSLLNLGYTYNADNDDGISEGGFGSGPPAIGVQIINGPLADDDGVDNDYDGVVDETGETLGMSSFIQRVNGTCFAGCRFTAQEFYDRARGRWKGGTPITVGGFGRHSGGPVTRFLYPAMPPDYWSLMNIDGNGANGFPQDRRMVIGVGPFTLDPGGEETVFLGVYTTFGTDNLDSISELKKVASRFVDVRPQDIGADSDPLPIALETPFALSPGDNASRQPVDIAFRWRTNEPFDRFQVQLAEGDDIAEGTIYWDQSLFDLASDAIYSWRVREYGPASYGPWSRTNTFSTGTTSARSDSTVIEEFVVTSNASGLLTLPVSASADWQGFPGDRPDSRQQFNSSGRWLIATGESRGCPDSCGSYNSFVTRSIIQRGGWESVVPFDWEIRFESTGGNFGWDVFSTDSIFEIPFSLWRTGIDTPSDPSDDVRYIPAIYDVDESGSFDLLSEDHSVSSGSNDPYTDWLYFFKPVDESPGSTGYDRWLSTKLAGGDATGLYDGQSIGRIVLVGWNHGDVSDGTLDAVPDSLRMPEPGTVFRIGLKEIDPPIITSPGWGERVPPGDVYLYWSSTLGEQFTVEIAPFITFSSLFESRIVDARETTLNLAPGTYYWRVRDATGSISRINQLVVDRALSVDVESTDSVEDPLSIFVAPNPVESMFQLVASKRLHGISDVEIFNVLGRRVMHIDQSGESDSRILLDGSNLSAGVYFVRVRTRSGQILSKSFVKQ